MAFWNKRPISDWHDGVVTISALVKQAGIASCLPNMVIEGYYGPRAVPRHEDDWHLPTIRAELQRLAKQYRGSIADAATTARRNLP